MNDTGILEAYAAVAGKDVMDHLRQLARPLTGLRIVHVNSTRLGGGVAEILHKMVPLMRALGLDAAWEITEGDPVFYQCTKRFHNGIQGNRVDLPESYLKAYEETNRQTAETLRDTLHQADIVIIHDPQPAAMIPHFPDRRAKWVWRCHIDATRPFRPVWKYLRELAYRHDASIFSLAAFARRLPHPVHLIAPSIDPLHEKNVELDQGEIEATCSQFQVDTKRPIILQVSRFDGFVRSQKTIFFVLPAQAGIQSFQCFLDSRLRGSDDRKDFLRDHHALTASRILWE